jgi:hypothetical protein
MHGTAQRSPAGHAVHQLAEQVADSKWGEYGARTGLAARGTVYLILAYLVIRIALGALGRPGTGNAASGTGVAQAIVQQPGGRFVLVLLAAGLLLYALFSVLDAILHHDTESPAAKRWGDRALSAWGFVVYGAFCGYCVLTAAGPQRARSSAGRQDSQDTQWSARVLRWPAGAIWLALIGAVLIVIAAFLISRAIRRSFRPRLDERAMSRPAWYLAMGTGVAGYLGRAVLFGTVGGCILNAAWENDPRTGQGVDGSVRILAASTGGPVLLWVIAIALALYGGYLFLEARYRRV